MKNIVLVACLLTISYAINREKLEKLDEVFSTCAKELNVPKEYTPDVLLCAVKKYEVLDEQGLVIKDKLFALFADFISDENKLQQAKQIATRCIDQELQGEINNEKLITALKCGISVLDLYDKLE